MKRERQRKNYHSLKRNLLTGAILGLASLAGIGFLEYKMGKIDDSMKKIDCGMDELGRKGYLNKEDEQAVRERLIQRYGTLEKASVKCSELLK